MAKVSEEPQVSPDDPATMDRMNATLRRMVKMPPKAHDDMKLKDVKQPNAQDDKDATKSQRGS
jgi:hypothetical protein